MKIIQQSAHNDKQILSSRHQHKQRERRASSTESHEALIFCPSFETHSAAALRGSDPRVVSKNFQHNKLYCVLAPICELLVRVLLSRKKHSQTEWSIDFGFVYIIKYPRSYRISVMVRSEPEAINYMRVLESLSHQLGEGFRFYRFDTVVKFHFVAQVYCRRQKFVCTCDNHWMILFDMY